MAAVTHRVITPDTGNTPNTSGAFVPALNDLLIVFVVASATVEDPGTLTSSIGGFTFTQIARSAYRISSNSTYAFVADALVSDTSSQTVTFDTPSDPANGTIIIVASVSGMSKTGLTAIRQSAKEENGAASGTPAPAFGIAALTGNPTLGAVGNESNPAGLTEPTGWTEGGDTGYNTPTTGGEYVHRDSGFTGTTITWGSSSASAFGAIILELDSSGAGGIVGLVFESNVFASPIFGR